ncbi:MAG: hypothetical protein M3N07_05125 [Pseudomonadota bacterium]|nr:hypothetical protein [Pseudomonadota bacterium]
MSLIARIERYLERSATSPTRFGREVLGDPNLMRELRRGRELSSRTVRRVAAFLDRAEAALGDEPCRK